MIATSSSQPRPPHLLRTFPDMPPPTLKPSPYASAVESAPTAGRGIKGLFSRSRVLSPEPTDPTIRSRLRSFIGENKAGPSRQPLSKTSQSNLKSPTKDATSKRQGTRGKEGIIARPGSPDQTRRNIRFGPSLLPAIQKGNDGKWQPPSLSRGSLSTSALALYAQDAEEDEGRVEMKGKEEREKGSKHALAVLFSTKSKRDVVESTRDRTPRPMKTPSSSPSKPAPTMSSPRQADSGPDSGFSWQEVFPPISPSANLSRPAGLPAKHHTLRPLPRTSSDRPPAKVAPIDVDSATVRPVRPFVESPRSMPASPVRQAFPKTSMSVPASPTTRTITPTPIHQPTAAQSLSKDHYHLRLATSYMIRILTPFVRGSGFNQNDKLVEIKRHADEHIATLARMEKGWGGEWAKAAAGVGKGNELEAGTGLPANENKARGVFVSERAKERERKVWGEVMRDGILLCLYVHPPFTYAIDTDLRTVCSTSSSRRVRNISLESTLLAMVFYEQPT